jgi:hypothetical protein
MIKSIKDSLSFKSYKDKTYSKEVYKITAKTKKKPYKYRVGRKGSRTWMLIDKLLKSAPRDHTTNLRINARTTLQKKADDANEAKLEKKIEKDFKEHIKRLEQQKKRGQLTLNIAKSITNLKNIKDMWKRDGRAKKLIDDAQKDWERQMLRKGLKVGKQKRMKKGVELPDEDYVLPDEQPEEDGDEEEKQAEVHPPKKAKKVRKTKAWYVKKFSSLADKVLKQQARLDNVEGESLDRLIRDIQVNMQEGQELVKEIRAKKYKSREGIRVNLDFFHQ